MLVSLIRLFSSFCRLNEYFAILKQIFIKQIVEDVEIIIRLLSKSKIEAFRSFDIMHIQMNS